MVTITQSGTPINTCPCRLERPVTYDRSFVPPAGNPMRASFIMFAIFFPALIVGFLVYAYASGGPVGRMIGILFMLGVVGIICLAILAISAQAIEKERSHLSTDVWAVWHLPEEEYRAFVLAEWRHIKPHAIGLVAILFAVSVYFYVETDSLWFSGMTAGISLMVVLVAVMATVPPWRVTEKRLQVRIGARGVEAMGHYYQLRGSRRGLDGIGLLPGDPSVLLFLVYERGRRRPYEVRVPVPEGSEEEAKAIVERFAPRPPADETYPELLRRRQRERAENAAFQ